MRRLVPWLPVIALALVLFVASAQPNLRFARDETEDFVVRKIGHVIVYTVGTLLLWRALALTTRVSSAWAWATGIALVFAISDELHQIGVQGREPSVRDVLIDAAGVVAAVLVGQWLTARRSRQRGAG